MSSKIFTIGYGNRNIQAFIKLLQKYEIEILIDVRTNPFSRYNPDFSSKKLELHLINNDIRYLFLGHELGGKPTDLSCYTNNVLDYEKIKSKSFFGNGIEEVIQISKSGLKSAIMCAELSPSLCHRKSIIGLHLKLLGFNVQHIDRDGAILTELFEY
ncbi:DUF488 domain-containing protein [Flavobacterium mekongense]|uniref:DUF488 domain-containing protein n=1 Tax=Flavobacterium mekongense TaxID=3379707 RepID=UPI00399A88FA